MSVTQSAHALPPVTSAQPSRVQTRVWGQTGNLPGMVDVLNPDLERRGKRGGQNRLKVEDPLLIALSYWRQYRTHFDIGLEFGVSEATVCRTIEQVEALLVKSGRFRLPGKRQLQQAETGWDAVVIDGTEVAIERPKKTACLL